MFNVGNEDEVFDYLSQKPHLITSLSEINAAIKDYFPRHGKAKLDLVHDPDVEGYERLFVYIPYDGEIEEVYKVFKKFKKKWFYQHYKEIKGLINIDLDFS